MQFRNSGGAAFIWDTKKRIRAAKTFRCLSNILETHIVQPTTRRSDKVKPENAERCECDRLILDGCTSRTAVYGIMAARERLTSHRDSIWRREVFQQMEPSRAGPGRASDR